MKSLVDGSLHTNRVDCALLAIGRVPNIESLDLAKAGVKVDPRSGLVANDSALPLISFDFTPKSLIIIF